MSQRLLSVRVRSDVADFLRGANLVEAATRKMGEGAKRAGEESKRGLSGMAQHVRDNRDAYTQVGGALTAYGAAVTGITVMVAKTGVEYNTLRQRSGAALTTMTGSAEAANAQMAKLDDFASNSPFARDVFIKAQQQMFGFRIESEKVIPYLDAIQNAVAATGGSNNDIAELSTIFSQISASAKITATDLREFGNRGIDAATIIGSQMGMTGAQIREQITAGTLDAGDALDALAAGMQDTYGGAADNVKNTMLGAVDRVKAAFRDLSSSAMTVFVDPDGGGIAVDGLNRLADALRAFESMPAGVRNTALAVGALSGAAALVGGAAMLAVPRMVDFYDALGKMGTQGRLMQDGLRRAPGIIGGLTKAAAGAGVLLTVAAGLQRITQSSWEAAPGIEEVTRALLDVRDVGNQGQLDDLVASMEILGNGTIIRAEPITDVAGAISRLDNPSALQRMEDLDKLLPGVQTSGDRAAEALAAIDAALVGLVNSGDVVTAQESLAAALDGTGISVETALRYLPAYRDALVGVENEARAAAGGAGDLAGALVLLPEGAPSYLDRLRESAATMSGAIATAAGSFVDFGESIGDAEVSLDGWLSKIEEQLVARANYLENIAFLQAAGVNAAFLQGLAEQGADGQLRAQQMVDAITGGDTAVVDRANGIGRRMGDSTVQAAAAAIAGAEFPAVEFKSTFDENSLHRTVLYGRQVVEDADPANLPVTADMARAEQERARWVVETADTVGVTQLSADPDRAYRQIEDWNLYASRVTGLPTLDADPAKAARQLQEWRRRADRSTGTPDIDADPRKGDDKRIAFLERVTKSNPIMKMFLNDDPAREKMRMFFQAYQGTRIGVNIGFGNENGAIMDRGTRYADGGIDAAGNHVPRVPQMGGPAYGKRYITWGEDPTTWEGYISGKAGMEERNVGVWLESARRLPKDMIAKALASEGHRWGMTALDQLGVERVNFANGGMWSQIDLDVPERENFDEAIEGAQGKWMESLAGRKGTPGRMPWPVIWALTKQVAPEARMTSNYRPGDTTAGYGNTSLHALGRAIDVVSNNMRATFMKILAGMPWPNELIHTPMGGLQINRGGVQTGNFPLITRLQHYDHIHLGYDKGGIVEAMSRRPKIADTGHLRLEPGWNPPTYNGLGRPEHMVDAARFATPFVPAPPVAHAQPAAPVDTGQIASAVAGAMSGWQPVVEIDGRQFRGMMLQARADSGRRGG